MLSKTVSLGLNSTYVNFRSRYDETQLAWLQFMEIKLKSRPKLLFKHGDRLVVFVDTIEFLPVLRKWQYYLDNRRHRFDMHVRVLPFSNNLEVMIRNWYHSIKDLQIKIEIIENCININLVAPSNLQQFLIGKKGKELECLGDFLNRCIVGDFNFHIRVE
ncbi:MAG: hypothetical protein ACTSVU_05595 [Promethearchaeota archaeon]